MTFGDYSTPALAFLSTFVVGMASALIPVINAELFIIFLGTVASRQMLPWLVLVSTVSHMAGKAVLYYAGRAADRLPDGWLKTKILRAQKSTHDHDRMGGALVFTSSLVGLPPFYVITVASGVVRLPFVTYMVAGFVGRLIRFGLIAAFPGMLGFNQSSGTTQ
jgi:membrane protein YqaA with SNARE-associated domain